MIKQHQSFEYISDETVLWQYMPLTKFLFLIKFRKLHFHRIDDLMDKEEGILSELDKKQLPIYSDTRRWNEYLEGVRKMVFVSCWIKYQIENSLMWQSYGKEGVAIRTTAGSIRRAMIKDKDHIVHMINVRYIDKGKEPVQIPGTAINWLLFSTTKCVAFEQEKEVRLLFSDDDRKYKGKGVNIDIDINELIKEIKVSSIVPEYVFKLICREVEDSNIKIVPTMSNI